MLQLTNHKCGRNRGERGGREDDVVIIKYCYIRIWPRMKSKRALPRHDVRTQTAVNTSFTQNTNEMHSKRGGNTDTTADIEMIFMGLFADC